MGKTCCIDVDGVLNSYPQAWLKFLSARGYSYSTLEQAKTGLAYDGYTQLKHMYRRSPEKRFQPPRQGAAGFTYSLADMGYTVIIKTSRPIQEHPHLVGWTHDWLREHGFTFKETLFNRHNPAKALSTYPDLAFIVDDNREQVDLFNSHGVQAFLFDGDYRKILEALK